MAAISFLPTSSDLVAAQKLHYRLILKSRRSRSAYLAFVIVMALISLMITWEEPVVEKLKFMGFLFVLCALVPLAIVWLNFILMPRKARTIFSQQKSLQREVRIDWDDAGFSSSSDQGSQRMDWTDLLKVADNEAVILLYHSDNLFNFIPKRVLSPAQAAELPALARGERSQTEMSTRSKPATRPYPLARCG